VPPLESDFILVPQQPNLSVALEPVPSNLHSLMMLNEVEQLSGLGEWVTQTAASLPAERMHINQLVFIGLFYAIQPDRRWPSFPAYVDALAAQPAEALRDRLFSGIHNAHCRLVSPGDDPGPVPDTAPLLASVEAYLSYLREQFVGVELDIAIETETHALLNDPPAMQNLIVSHMRTMWRDILAPEWRRVLPMLQESVAAFQQLDFADLSAIEAARMITGQDLTDKWEKFITTAKKIIFVPSAHIGPYLGKIMGEKVLWILFGARLPEGAQSRSSALSRSELLTRLGALTDDTRLLILELLSQHEELCAQDIITQLDLSQSAASRHLRQLSATGYLTERRRDGAKCYSLNRERVDDTFHALEHFLAHHSEHP
jgi:DNA-binding transcriptional ArsR family regulator